MRFMVMHYSTEDNEAGVPPTPEDMAAIGELMQDAAMNGVLLSGEGVHPSSKGARIENNDGNIRVIDGPFAEAKELIAGFCDPQVPQPRGSDRTRQAIRFCRWRSTYRRSPGGGV